MKYHRLKKVLIANRGEIAVRIQRACEKLGIAYVQAHSSIDAPAMFVRRARASVCIGEAAAKDSYLNIERILTSAQALGCDACHPGYGFLSENAEFAAAVTAAGIRFIGPSASSIQAMASKTEARSLVASRGVPVVPGSGGDLSDQELRQEAERIGYPLLLKAQAGGGGRGMRVVRSAAELSEALARARAEAGKFFSNQAIFLERYIEEPRHVEVQVFGDSFGNLLQIGTRDCSAQRRHQKLVEEAPAPFLSQEVQQRLQAAAIEAARCVNYRGAGTVEFLVKGEEVYFLEMNTRIQVEHPVTEQVSGLDLVALQLIESAGNRLPVTQEEVTIKGHALEVRVVAEDVEAGFSPQTGRIASIVRPQHALLRDDFGFEGGDNISPFYDGLIGKIVVWGDTRERCLARARKYLEEYKVVGLPTTLDLGRWLVQNETFNRQGIDIGFIEREFSARQESRQRVNNSRARA